MSTARLAIGCWLAAVRWYLREVSGEGRWQRYLADSRAHGVAPLDRRSWERQRYAHRDRHPEGRCC